MARSRTTRTDLMERTVLSPDESRAAHPALAAHGLDVWVHTFRQPATGWQLSVATHAAPGSAKLSLGGFRIVPKALADEPGFTTEKQAIGLAIGMEGKVYWSRLIHAGGPLALRDTSRVVGGKCVLLPTDDARVGAPRDADALDFAVAALQELEASAGFHVVTGQDLGHGTMHDGTTGSLQYLHRRFPGSVVADTSKPTGEGNYHTLLGMLGAFSIPLRGARVGLVGAGNIGGHILDRLLDDGADVTAVEANPAKRELLQRRGVRVLSPEQKAALLRQPLDALVVNANKRSLDSMTVDAILGNATLRVICGSENEAMPDPADADRLRAAGKVYTPTEFGGMMGFLTAVEEYYHHLEGTTLDVGVMMEAARRLDPAARAITERIIASQFMLTFAEAARDVFAPTNG